MCGLFGFVHLSKDFLDPQEIEFGREALNILEHRGPDQYSDHVVGAVYMGHRRLSILDLSEEGRQPMMSADGNIIITVNGEIYNFKTLRTDLGEARFRSSSDSEVVLHGYSDWGLTPLIEKIDGMYACIILDADRRKLHFVRDRAGVKPLIYARVGEYFLWASELKAIVKFATLIGETLHVEPSALYDFLTYRYIPGTKTLYREALNLLPAHFLTLDLANGHYKTSCYWVLDPTDMPVDHDVAANYLRELIYESVEEQMVSDVPVGFFLSGGMDSSILVSQAARVRDNLSTFSIGYDHAAHDETHFAQIVANEFNTSHRKEILHVNDAENLISMILDWYDQPFGDNSALPTYHVSRFARETATVALSGDGGDELFGGYRWYKRFAQFSVLQSPFRGLGKGLRLNSARHCSGILQKFAQRLDLLTHNDPLELYTMLIDGLPESKTRTQRAELEIPDDYDAFWHFRSYDRPDLSLRKRMQFIDFHTFLPDDILTKVDRVSMAVSLEARVPFLSRKIMEYAFSLPEDFLYKNGELKGGLKYAFRHDLPDSILNRDKKGFSIPLHVWRGSQEQEKRFQEHVYGYYMDII